MLEVDVGFATICSWLKLCVVCPGPNESVCKRELQKCCRVVSLQSRNYVFYTRRLRQSSEIPREFKKLNHVRITRDP